MRAKLAYYVLITAGRLAQWLDPENVAITVKLPEQPKPDWIYNNENWSKKS